MLEFLGRLHPLILHLPIGILIFCFLLEMFFYWSKEKHSRNVQTFSLFMAAITASFSLITGLLLVRNGDYGGDLVNNHRISAFALTILSWMLLFSHFWMVRSSKSKNVYFGLLTLTAISLGITGHLGGSITHGENFLLESNEIVVTANINDAILYDDIIFPILESKCISCHNPTKLKGDLNMTTPELMMNGGKEGMVILKDSLLESPLLKRIHLELNAKEHMPPEGKKQLSKDELALIEWWLSKGASFENKAVETEDFQVYESIASKFLSPPLVSIFDKVKAPDSTYMVKLVDQGMKIYPISLKNSGVYVNFLDKIDLEAKDLKQLNKVKKNIAHLNLAGSNINDETIHLINKFVNLEKLELQNTTISSEGINKLKEFKYLKTLNIFNTKVDSTSMDKLLSFPQLQNLYIWQSELTANNASDIELAKPRLNVIFDINKDIFTDASLKAPVINAASEIFEDSIQVSIDLNFKNVDIFYSLDGSIPDSNSIKYEKPLTIKKSTLVRAIALKKSWEPSLINEKQFVKAGIPIKSIKLNNPPQSRYASIGSKNLNNQKLGSLLFSDGEWIGYQGEHASVSVDIGKVQDIEGISIGFLENTGSYIFYPEAIEVLGSIKGDKYTPIFEKTYIISDGPNSGSRKNFTLEFEKQKVQFIKINIKSHLKNPPWHQAPGEKCWIFFDEIMVN